MTIAPWSGRKVTEARTYMARRLPAPCGQCGKPVTTADRWVIGHTKSRILHPELTWDMTNWRHEHRACSDRTGQAAVIEKAKADALREAGVSSHGTSDGEAPPRPVSLPEAHSEPVAISEPLVWSSHRQNAPEWLLPYLDVPEDATPPTAMTPVHPESVGSYGPELIEWAQEQFRMTLRWWQALAIVRILEHKEDGSLCWPEVVMSCSRRSGKSVVVRLLALWRLVFAPSLFGEQQLIVHSASTLKIAKEPMRYATRWVEKQDNLKVVRNNNSPGVEDTEGDHRWLVVPSDRTAGLDTCLGILDESWAIKPEVVDDDLEPSLLERVSPQLLLISTAHRRATSLMRNRISSALAMEDARVLLLLWCAMPGDDPGDPETWRQASAYWTEDRADYVARKHTKALAGEQDPEFDDPDPMEGFKCQYLNMWPLKQRVEKGTPLTDAETWAGLRLHEFVNSRNSDNSQNSANSQDLGNVPDAVAIESWFESGISVARAWLVDGRAVVDVSDHPDLVAAVDAVTALGYRGRLTVGASLLDDPALKGKRVAAGKGRTAATVQELSLLLASDALRHAGSAHLTEQVLAVRTSPGADGPRMVSTGRADAVKAATWAAKAARKVKPKPVFIPITA